MSIALIVVRNPSIYACEVADSLGEGRKSLRLSGVSVSRGQNLAWSDHSGHLQ
jgi:hypothetical protein